MPVLVAAGVGGLLVLAAYAGVGVLALAVIGIQAMLAYGLTAARMPAQPAGTAISVPGSAAPGSAASGGLVAVAGASAVLALQLAPPEPSGPTIAPVLWVLGPAVVVALLLQLVRGDGRARLVEVLATTVSGVALAGLLALLVPLGELPPLAEVAVVTSAGGAVLGVSVWWLVAAGRGRWRWVLRIVAVGLVLGAAAAVASADVPELTTGGRAAIGSVVAVAGLVGAGAGSRLAEGASSRLALMPAVALALSGPAAYLTVRMLFW